MVVFSVVARFVVLLCCFVLFLFLAPVYVFFLGGGGWRRRNISFIGASAAELFTLVHQLVPKIYWPLTAAYSRQIHLLIEEKFYNMAVY